MEARFDCILSLNLLRFLKNKKDPLTCVINGMRCILNKQKDYFNYQPFKSILTMLCAIDKSNFLVFDHVNEISVPGI